MTEDTNDIIIPWFLFGAFFEFPAENTFNWLKNANFDMMDLLFVVVLIAIKDAELTRKKWETNNDFDAVSFFAFFMK